MLLAVLAALPPVNPVSPLQFWPSESVYAAPPESTKTPANGGSRLTVADELCVGSATLVAVTRIFCAVVMVAGAV